jgi:hypothetical protein
VRFHGHRQSHMSYNISNRYSIADCCTIYCWCSRSSHFCSLLISQTEVGVLLYSYTLSSSSAAATKYTIVNVPYRSFFLLRLLPACRPAGLPAPVAAITVAGDRAWATHNERVQQKSRSKIQTNSPITYMPPCCKKLYCWLLLLPSRIQTAP